MRRLTRQQAIDRLVRQYTNSELESLRFRLDCTARISDSPILRSAANLLLDAVKAAQKAEAGS